VSDNGWDQNQNQSQSEEQRNEQRNDSGLPGGGVGRRDEVRPSGVYPVSDMQGASPDAEIQTEEAWGQGKRGAAGYQDSGGSEIIPPDQPGETDK
jgi:hypothetical protein